MEKVDARAPRWLGPLSFQLLISAQVMISQFRGFELHVRLCTDSAEPAWGSPSHSDPLLFSLSLSLSK